MYALSVYNQLAYADNCADAVDRLLIHRVFPGSFPHLSKKTFMHKRKYKCKKMQGKENDLLTQGVRDRLSLIDYRLANRVPP